MVLRTAGRVLDAPSSNAEVDSGVSKGSSPAPVKSAVEAKSRSSSLVVTIVPPAQLSGRSFVRWRSHRENAESEVRRTPNETAVRVSSTTGRPDSSPASRSELVRAPEVTVTSGTLSMADEPSVTCISRPPDPGLTPEVPRSSCLITASNS